MDAGVVLTFTMSKAPLKRSMQALRSYALSASGVSLNTMERDGERSDLAMHSAAVENFHNHPRDHRVAHFCRCCLVERGQISKRGSVGCCGDSRLSCFLPLAYLPEGRSAFNPALVPELTLNWIILGDAFLFGTIYWWVPGWAITRLYRRFEPAATPSPSSAV
jgi:hypothetical protein